MSSHEGDWANPGPAGLVALGVACFLFYAVLAGKVEHSSIPLMGLWLLGGFVIQVMVAIIELKENNMQGGNIFLVFSGFFMLTTGLSFIFKYYASVNGWAVDTRIDGWAWIILTLSVWMWTPAFFKSPLVFILMVLSIDVACPFIMLMDIGAISHDYALIPANALLLAGLFGTYFAAAGILNTVYGRAVLPVGKPFVKEKEAAAKISA